MITKSALAKKLASYSTLTSALLVINKETKGQIVYHQVIPTFTINKPSGQYFLDLNGDGIYDFELSCLSEHTFTNYGGTIDKTYVTAIALNSNKLNANVFSKSSEVKSSQISSAIGFLSGSWSNAVDKYMPLKLVVGGNTYLGWVRMDVRVSGAVIQIKDYAYYLNSTDSIVMGDVGCSYNPTTPIISLLGGDTLTSSTSNKYQWSKGNSVLQGDTISSIYVANNYGKYSVITTNPSGCLAQSNTVNFIPCDSSNIRVYTYLDTTTCQGNQLNAYLLLDSIPYGFTNLQWYRNDTAIVNGASSLNYQQFLNYKSFFYAICYNPLTQCYLVSNSIDYTFYPVPPSPILNQHEDTIETKLKAGNYIYIWYKNGTIISGADLNYYLPDSSDTYTLTLTDTLGGCISQPSSINYNACYYVPSEISSQVTALGCKTDSIALHSYSSDDGFIYSWYIDSTTLSIPGAVDSVYYATTPGTYYFIITKPLQNCYIESKPYIITVADSPAVPLIFVKNDTLFTGIYSAYQWFLNGDSISGATNQYYVYTSKGSYTVEVTNVAGCSNVSNAYIVYTTGIDLQGSNDVITIYVQDDNIHINFSDNYFLTGNIELYNMKGEKLFDRQINNSTEILNGEQLAKGIYFVSITKNETRKIYKVALL